MRRTDDDIFKKADLIDSIGLEFPFEWLLLLLWLDFALRLLLFDELMGLRKFRRNVLILSDVLSLLVEFLPDELEASASTSLLSLMMLLPGSYVISTTRSQIVRVSLVGKLLATSLIFPSILRCRQRSAAFSLSHEITFDLDQHICCSRQRKNDAL